MKRWNKREPGAPAAVVIGIVIAIGVSIIELLFATMLIAKEKIPQSSISISNTIIWGISVLLGTISAGAIAKQNRLLVSALTGSCYCALLLCVGMLFFEGSLAGIGAGLPTIGIVCGLSGMLHEKKHTCKMKSYKYRK